MYSKDRNEQNVTHKNQTRSLRKRAAKYEEFKTNKRLE